MAVPTARAVSFVGHKRTFVHPKKTGKKKPAEAGFSYWFVEKAYDAFRRIQPSRPIAEPNSQTAAGTGT